jgi:hypothetical protein
MLQLENGWPEPKEHLAIRVLIHKETDTHTIDFTEDGILAISTKETPTSEYVKQSAPIAGYAALNQAGINALWEALNEVRLQAS